MNGQTFLPDPCVACDRGRPCEVHAPAPVWSDVYLTTADARALRAATPQVSTEARELSITLARAKKATPKVARTEKTTIVVEVGQFIEQGEVVATDGKTLTVLKVDGTTGRFMARMAKVVA